MSTLRSFIYAALRKSGTGLGEVDKESEKVVPPMSHDQCMGFVGLVFDENKVHTDYANRVLFEAVLYAPLELLDVGQHGVNELLVKGMFSTRNDLRHKKLWDVPRDFL